MKPLFNLKAFVAVLVILIVPAALLLAYFRNYSPEAGGHEHTHMALDSDKMAKGGDTAAVKSGEHSHAVTGHAAMAESSGGKAQNSAHGSQPAATDGAESSDHAAMGHGTAGKPPEPLSKPAAGHQHSPEKSEAKPQADHPHAGETPPTDATRVPEHQHNESGAKAASQAATNNPHAGHENTASPAAKATSTTPSHQHGNTAATNTSASGSAQSHGTNSPSAGSPNWMPDTPEGIWKELHRHQSELQTAIAAKQLDKLHVHAEAVKRLTAALVDVVHPNYKTSVARGAEKVNQGIIAAHKSAHADDLAGVESHFQEFNDALHELEQQMRKQ